MTAIKSTDVRKKAIMAALKNKSGGTKVTDVHYVEKERAFIGKCLRPLGNGKFESLGHFSVSETEIKVVTTIPVKSTDGKPFKVEVLEPTVPEAKELTQEDVWGIFVSEGTEDMIEGGKSYKVSKGHFKGGMIVARGQGRSDKPAVICPIFGDVVPHKSVTAICAIAMEPDVTYWLEYVEGGNCISQRKVLPGGRVALRADYQCW
jgi:hypothetical protein